MIYFARRERDTGRDRERERERGGVGHDANMLTDANDFDAISVCCGCCRYKVRQGAVLTVRDEDSREAGSRLVSETSVSTEHRVHLRDCSVYAGSPARCR